MDSPRAGDLRFSIDARHVRQLGRELVADRVTAVSELIKNAYDADATQVEVVFSDDSRERAGGSLLIRDNGSGMDFDDVRSRWMVISTAFKDAATKSDGFERLRAGQKGIGRFATESLGARLQLRSTKAGSAERTIVDFDWEVAYEPGLPLDEVTNPFRIEPDDLSNHGTELQIDDLHHVWDERSLQRVREAIFLLQPPFRVAEVDRASAQEPGVDPGFRVAVHYKSVEPDTAPPGDIEAVFAAATAWVEGTVHPDGTVTRAIRSEHLGIDEVETVPGAALVTGPLTFRAAYYIFNRNALDPDASIGVRRARALANRYGGIRLYRDGLRILPYGEPGNDWLGLDAIYRKRGQILSPIGNANFFGEALVSRAENLLLVDTASREGVLENEAFDELRVVLRNALTWAVNEVAAVRQRKQSAGRKKDRARTSRSDLVGSVVEAAERAASADSDQGRQAAIQALVGTVAELQDEARRSDRDEQGEMRALLDELSLLRVLASVGAAIAVFSHEVRTVLTQALAAVGDLAESLDAGTAPQRAPILAAEQGLGGMADLAAYLDLYISQTGRRARQEQSLEDVIGTFAERVRPLLRRRGVEIEADVDPPHIRTAPMSRSELEAILYNLLTNALKALDDEGLDQRRILIAANESEDALILRFSDTGRGIDERVRDRIFDAFVTTTEESDGELGAGTGLGLKIVADIAQANGGRVDIGREGSPFRTCMEVTLPAWRPDREGDR